MLRDLIYLISKKVNILLDTEAKKRIAREFNFKNVNLGKGFIEGNINIGEFTYINDQFRIVTGSNSSIEIGSNCAVGRNFNCAARTHDLKRPTPIDNETRHLQVESSIKIGSHVWIGDNVVIKPGINISDYAVIGANSVVTRDVKRFEIVGGVPARHLKFNTDHEGFQE
jgi:acetyltransferase-like isoleucine patch superfamily enzyme